MVCLRSSVVALAGFATALLGASGCAASSSEDVAQSGQAVTASDVYNFGAIAHSGSCLDAQGGGTGDGTQLQEWRCNGTGAQAFQLTDAGNGAFAIFNAHAGKCVDVQGNGTANGTKVQLYDCNGTGAQSFFMTDAGDGFVHFVNAGSGKCLDVTADDPADGTRVQLYDCNGTNAQRWNPSVVGSAAPPFMGDGGNGGNGGNGGGGGTPEPGWQLTWSDEFDGPDGSGVDPGKWTFATGGNGWGNQELEYYTSGTANAVVEEGSLVVTATTDGASSYSCWYGPCRYTSARLTTSGKFSQTYGRFEARMALPEGQGVWPAFWLLGENYGSVGWPACGEIDVMEAIGSSPDSTYGTTHGPGPGAYPGAGLSGAFTSGAPLGAAFHLYATEWEPGSVRFYVDGFLYWTVTPSLLPAGASWVWDHPFFVLLNFAVGGDWPGSPDGSSAFPQQMKVDYVRVYAKAGG